MYKNVDLNEGYPANLKRLEIIINLLKKYKPKKVVDAGCGAAMPLIKLRKLGFNVTGYDKSDNMIEEARNNLIQNRLDPKYVSKDDFEKVRTIKNNSIECIIGLGTFYYSRDFKTTLIKQVSKLKKNGRLIFSLRNQLFDIATMNDYSIDFFTKFFDLESRNSKEKVKFKSFFSGFTKKKNENIDTKKVFSVSHNPITIDDEILSKVGLKLEGIYYYHFHILPPTFEKFNKLKFREESLKIENPNDWKGMFKASCFVVNCKKM
jgi:SAM-dependent methyltransferase